MKITSKVNSSQKRISRTLGLNVWWLTIATNGQICFKNKLELCSAVKRKNFCRSTLKHCALQYALEQFMVMHNKKKVHAKFNINRNEAFVIAKKPNVWNAFIKD